MPRKGEAEANMNKLLQSKRRGSAIALVLLVIVILLATGTGLLSLGLRSRIFAIRNASDITARCAADAGLTIAVFEMNEKLKVKPWDDSTLPQVTERTLLNCDAIFSYTATGDLDNGYIIESVGKSNQAERKVSSTLRLKGLFDSAILVQDTITLVTGTLVEGYDPENPSEGDVPVEIATTSDDAGDITLGPGAEVDGEVLVGVQGYFPPVNPPTLPDMGTDIDIFGGTLTIGPGDSGMYTDISAARGPGGAGVLEIDGGDVVLYVTGNILLGQDCEILIRPDSSLTLYLDGDLTGNNSCGVNNETQDATCFALYGTGEDQDIELRARSDFYGAVYAPNADITIRAGCNVCGSFISESFTTTGTGSLIRYDAALRNVTTTDVGVVFVVQYWSEE